YVVGDFEPGEFATQALRTQLVAKMTDREGWNASYELGHLVVNQLKQELGVPFSKSGGGTSYAVEPGLFARNLGIPSQLDGAAVTYVEAFFYDDP
ncbi:TPA: hypothetical protein REU63_003167, partial [Listeria monocytogenes]|nr:hypothetical protein [Listeria monocytogenes]